VRYDGVVIDDQEAGGGRHGSLCGFGSRGCLCLSPIPSEGARKRVS
jgi:hypothetical protein